LSTKLSLTERNGLDIETIVEYNDLEAKETLLVSQRFPLGLKNPQFHYGIPYGHSSMNNVRQGLMRLYESVKGPAFMPLEWYRVSRTAQRWLDVSNGDFGFTLASNRQMFVVRDDRVECVLLAVTPAEAGKAEAIRSGKVVSRFRVVPHSGSWRTQKTYRSGWELNSPLIAYTVNDTVSTKTLPPSLSFLSTSSGHAVVTVLKKAEDGDGVVVRLFEAEGEDGMMDIVFFRPVESAWLCNLLEEREDRVKLNRIKLKGNEIKTLRLLLQNGKERDVSWDDL